MRKLLIGVVLLAIVAAVLVLGKQPQPFTPGSNSAARLQPGSQQVLEYDETFVDASRPTAANGDYAGSRERRLDSTVWYPAERKYGPYPLLVYSHGFSSSRDGGAYLARHMASLGYVVVAPDFPLTNMYAPGGPNVRDVVHQPADVSFLIDRILEQGNRAGHVLEGRVDESRVGVFGLSLGGLTTELVSFHPELRDPRVGAALSIAGPTYIFAPRFYARSELPFLMLAGDIDALVPWASNAKPIPGVVPGGELVTIRNASHTGFAGPSALLRWLPNPDLVGCYLVERNLAGAMQEPWYDQLGTPEQGILYDAPNELCNRSPLPRAMNVLRQQMISTVVVASFFEREFSSSPAERTAASGYLQTTLPGELAEVSYQNAAQQAAVDSQL